MVCRIFLPRYGTNPTMMAGLVFAAATLLAPPASAATSGVVNLTAGEARQVWLGPTYWWLRVCNEACGWEAPPDYVVRDRDCAYGDAVIRRLRDRVAERLC